MNHRVLLFSTGDMSHALIVVMATVCVVAWFTYGEIKIQKKPLFKNYVVPTEYSVLRIINRDDNEKTFEQLVALERVCSGLYSFPLDSPISRNPSLLRHFAVPKYINIGHKYFYNPITEVGQPYFIELSNGMLVINPRLAEDTIFYVFGVFSKLVDPKLRVTAYRFKDEEVERANIVVTITKHPDQKVTVQFHGMLYRIVKYWADNFK